MGDYKMYTKFIHGPSLLNKPVEASTAMNIVKIGFFNKAFVAGDIVSMPKRGRLAILDACGGDMEEGGLPMHCYHRMQVAATGLEKWKR